MHLVDLVHLVSLEDQVNLACRDLLDHLAEVEHLVVQVYRDVLDNPA